MTETDTFPASATAVRAAGAVRAVVVGGGLAGMLAVAALREAAGEILVVEPDELPAGAAPRRGLPQADHVHLLWSGGVDAAESLLPGVTDAWLAAGARRIPVPTDVLALSSQGWMRRWERDSHYLIACSRDLLDAVVRRRVLGPGGGHGGGVTVVGGARVVGLLGDARRVTGVVVRHNDGSEEKVEADFVVDASGRSSRTPRHLAELGAGPVPERVVDAGLVYASRRFRAPAGAGRFPVVSVSADARCGRPGQSANLLPIENGQWLVTASGTRGGEPGRTAEEFEPFLRSLRHPIIADLTADLEPLSGVTVNRSTRNLRHYYEKARIWPERFVVLGDAVAVYNPLYGHGMAVAAQGAAALRGRLAAGGITAPRLARRVQRDVARHVTPAWSMATGQDVFYPGATGGPPGSVDRLAARYTDRMLRTAAGSYLVMRKFTDVTALHAPLHRLMGPTAVLGTALGPRRPPLSGPPLTPGERALLRDTPGVRR
ncbi:FAD-dependent monooxygenase [Streptomyces yaizuensis]|uniref:FAD-dependent oxidoreductase n=1 Tax=Streptomyces yaizuensis TaxID=2989713 RepID=A0ABQ5P128_9ACTN|nr:FAD-dependent monooxygenase [Streptomyces sp. YSPA8]GLF96311.1 FAD-dependent oxidoreductase [Streptomyces sp. YSPA8]